MRWIKSSYSGGNGGNCLEFMPGVPDVVPVRDSKRPEGPVLGLTPQAWSAFVAGVAGDGSIGWPAR